MKKIREAFDTRLVIQIVSLVSGLTFVWATSNTSMLAHFETGGIHMGYRELSNEFVSREIFDTKMTNMEKQLNRIETLLNERINK